MENSCRKATVSDIKTNTITVTFIRPEACSECAAQLICAQINGTQNSLEFKVADTTEYHIGQQVNLELEKSSVIFSLTAAFGIPLIIILTTLFGILASGGSENLASMAALTSLVFYYLLLYAFRRRIRNKIKIKLTAS